MGVDVYLVLENWGYQWSNERRVDDWNLGGWQSLTIIVIR